MPTNSSRRALRVFCNCIKCHGRPPSHRNIVYGVSLATALNHASRYGRYYPLEHFSYDFGPARPGARNYSRDKYPSAASEELSDDEEVDLLSSDDFEDDHGDAGACGHSGDGHEHCHHAAHGPGCSGHSKDSLSSNSDSEPGSSSSDESSSDESSSEEESSEEESSSEDESSDSESEDADDDVAADAARARLKNLQPGRDGGRKKRRHKRGVYDVEGVRRAPPAVRNRVLQICMMVLADKEEGNSHSATDYQRSMRTIWEILRSCSGVEERLVADLLPTLFTGALSMLEDWGMTDGFLRQAGIIEYDRCQTCDSLYRGIKRYDTACRKCAAQQPAVESLRKDAKKLMYCTVAAHMQRVFNSPVLAEAMHKSPEWVSTDGSIASSLDSDVVGDLRMAMGGRPGDVVIYVYYDPFQPFNDNSKYSSAPLVAILQNLPQHLRWEHCAAHLVSLQPGTRDKDQVPDRGPMMEVLANELEWLGLEGVVVWDAFTQSRRRVHVRMGALLSDYKGLQEVTRMLGTPTIYGCFKCWHGGFWACRGKRIWCNHYAQLPAGHVHRARLSSYHNPGVAPPPRTSREGPPRLRTRTELIRKVRHPIEPAPLIAGEASPVVINVGQALLATMLVADPVRAHACFALWQLLYLDLTKSIQYDCMHVFSGNVKDIFLMLCGHLPKPLSLIREYDAQENMRWLQGEAPWKLKPYPKGKLELSLKEMGRYVRDGTRLAHLLMPSAAHKAHTHIQTCSCLGLYAIAVAAYSERDPLPMPQARAIMALLHAIGNLWNNDVQRADIPALAAKMVEAVCLCELHLSSNLCDVKFHALVHAALSITALGPLPQWSMFQAESAWGWLKVNARNANHAEATMLFSWMDKMLTDLYYLKSLEPKPYYYTKHYINFPSRIQISLPRLRAIKSCSLEEHVALLQYYIAVIPAFNCLWTGALEAFASTHSRPERRASGVHKRGGTWNFDTPAHLRQFYKFSFRDDVERAVGRPLRRAEQALCALKGGVWTLRVSTGVAKSSHIKLGPVTLTFSHTNHGKRGDLWVMHRKGLSTAFQVPRFSNFLGAYLHEGPDGLQHTLLRVEWRQVAPSAHHPLIRAPLALAAKETDLPQFCLAQDVVPHPCWGMRDPSDASQIVMLTEDRWHVLRLLGFDPIS